MINYRNTDYAANGNITNRSDIGDYAYTKQDAGPHAFTGLSNTTGNLLPATNQTVDYTAFNKASHISQGNLDYFITYGPDRLRTKTSLISGIADDVLLTKYYAFGDYERETDATGTRHLHYISAGDGLAAIYVKNENADDTLYFILKDHLGSIVCAINAESGHVYRQSFDAWGRKRNPENWTYSNIPDLIFDRGFTGHEHLAMFGLINMNGRMYDAAICRFLSPDPYVQMPDYTQNFNRYSYALNNPLIYTDPTGEFIFLVPNIGWSKEGSLSAGLSLVFGIPGVASFQIGGGYSFQSNEPYAYAGASAMFNTVYTSVSPSGGASVGYTFGMSPFSGFPISSNFGTVGVDYNISNDIWSGNFSAWSINKEGMTFNPSVSAMIFPEQTTNLVRGQGFRSNDGVLNRFVEAGNHQGALNYFGFMGSHINTDGYTGSTKFHGDHLHGKNRASITYGNSAFTSYETLLSMYMKERYHYRKFVRGRVPNMTTKAELLSKGASEDQIKRDNLIFAPEEFEGFEYAYKKAYLYKTKESHMYNYGTNVYGYYADKQLHLIRYRFYRKW